MLNSGKLRKFDAPVMQLLLVNQPISLAYRDAAIGSPAAQHATVLLIDDEPAVLHSQEILLRTMGYCVLSAADTDSARRLARSADSQPDLIITDYRLPEGETGSELIERLREETGRQLPAIILTGDVALARPESEPARCLLLKKPVTIEDLQEAINRQLAHRTGRDRPEQTHRNGQGNQPEDRSQDLK